ncbi:AAA family ATPase [Chitinophaga sp. 30R24]|uniref:AAA family ATPase n=1 Tax=Chitinophaga sp. 30R24 TaxID=3248838 RepID=UPI003B8ED927
MKELALVDKLHVILQHLKTVFVSKDDIIDLMGICLASRENLFLLGPPGTAKSALVRGLANQLDGKTFEYLLTRFTEPNELFGPFDIRKLREGELLTNTEGMLPEASFIFLDELLNANSAILNSLLMVLNERIFRRGKETRPLPALMIVGASNHLPEEEALQALYDRFLLRATCENTDPAHLQEVLLAGWKLEQPIASHAGISTEEVQHLQQLTHQVNLDHIRPIYIALIQQLRNAGLKLSDRRAVKLQRVIAASALLCKRMVAIPSDMWVLRYIWDTTEQREIISGIVNAAITTDNEITAQHPRARINSVPDADELYAELTQMLFRWDNPESSEADKAAIKDRLRYLNGRCEWIANPDQRQFVMQPVDQLWKKILQENER